MPSPSSLGDTRSGFAHDHLLQTPDTFVRAPLPGMSQCTGIVHAAPAIGARFVQYTAEFEPGGCLGPTIDQRFLYVLEGTVTAANRTLGPSETAYFPNGDRADVTASERARVAVIEKPHQQLAAAPAPKRFLGREADAPISELGGDPWVEVRALIPDSPSFDFRVNTMTYRPGASLAAPEIHVMEHGLLMLEGGGIYRLGTKWYSVQAGDFIWMAPYCPQWFGAIGKTPAKYLIYKDWDRHPRDRGPEPVI
jgi:(S)-ureidoglycine aminohydrolase